MKRSRTQSVEALHAGALKAIKSAVTKAIRQHEAAGVPAAVWRGEKVVYLLKKRKK
ncbi:MAG: hypothetical protein HYU34_02370 [Candidatus Omnitrophica bacterium]|nr:hypothetical protein [Candidatus Omnitrophota bacterium]